MTDIYSHSEEYNNINSFLLFCSKDNLRCAKYLYYTYINCPNVLTDGLYEACKNNAYSIVKWATIHLGSVDYQTMTICILYNSYKIFKLLIELQDITISQMTDLYLTACKNNRVKFIEHLYKNKIIYYEQKNEILNTCFYYYFNYDLQTVELLINLGANPRTHNDMYFKSVCIRKKYDIVIYLCSVIDNYLFEDDKIIIMTDEQLLKYKMDLTKNHISVFKEELMIATWHPSRFQEWCLSYSDIV
jgi:hypothetical protein